jgi:hypothetical protein
MEVQAIAEIRLIAEIQLRRKRHRRNRMEAKVASLKSKRGKSIIAESQLKLKHHRRNPIEAKAA